MNYFRVVFVLAAIMLTFSSAAYNKKITHNQRVSYYKQARPPSLYNKKINPFTVCNTSYNTKLSLSAGGERIATLIKPQNQNLFTRISLSKEFLKFKEIKLNLGLEAAAKSGFFGSLDTSDEVQDIIGGPTPVVLAGPRIQVLATIRKYISGSNVFAISKLGMEFNTIKFDRYDFDNLTTVNVIGCVGIGLVLNKRSEINVAVGSSRPMTTIKFPKPVPASKPNPYTLMDVLVSFGYVL